MRRDAAVGADTRDTSPACAPGTNQARPPRGPKRMAPGAHGSTLTTHRFVLKQPLWSLTHPRHASSAAAAPALSVVSSRGQASSRSSSSSSSRERTRRGGEAGEALWRAYLAGILVTVKRPRLVSVPRIFRCQNSGLGSSCHDARDSPIHSGREVPPKPLLGRRLPGSEHKPNSKTGLACVARRRPDLDRDRVAP